MCYMCVVCNKILVQVLDTNRFQPTYFGSVGAFERKKNERVHREAPSAYEGSDTVQ